MKLDEETTFLQLFDFRNGTELLHAVNDFWIILMIELRALADIAN